MHEKEIRRIKRANKRRWIFLVLGCVVGYLIMVVAADAGNIFESILFHGVFLCLHLSQQQSFGL
jgi:hypothetical protein